MCSRLKGRKSRAIAAPAANVHDDDCLPPSAMSARLRPSLRKKIRKTHC